MILTSQGVFALACYLLVGAIVSAKVPYHEMRETMSSQLPWVRPLTWAWIIAAYRVGLAVAWPALAISMYLARRDADALPKCPTCGGFRTGPKIDAEFDCDTEPAPGPVGLRFHGSWEFARNLLADPRYRARRDSWPEAQCVRVVGRVENANLYRTELDEAWYPRDSAGDLAATDWSIYLCEESPPGTFGPTSWDFARSLLTNPDYCARRVGWPKGRTVHTSKATVRQGYPPTYVTNEGDTWFPEDDSATDWIIYREEPTE